MTPEWDMLRKLRNEIRGSLAIADRTQIAREIGWTNLRCIEKCIEEADVVLGEICDCGCLNQPHPAHTTSCACQEHRILEEWINEDELPDGYPYDEMFPLSKLGHDGLGGVRLFPFFPKVASPSPEVRQAWEAGRDAAAAFCESRGWHHGSELGPAIRTITPGPKGDLK